ncbi:hypothetical protein OPW33_22990 [Vibrio europaeus]|uniref:hypothetical protein n=1 Tax=Vibrio europaeus TaxID=300876 RepID=UPI0023425C25|nr:hypothetical protein [Vibrio europaeus]MDC5842197.1 hypothetical protein [Vibrio europaeus]
MDLISVLGSVASLWGAWFAWTQAKESKLAASVAERIKNQLTHHRDIENISKLEPLSKVAISKMRKYSVSRGEDSAGFSPHFDADHVQEYIMRFMLLLIIFLIVRLMIFTQELIR